MLYLPYEVLRTLSLDFTEHFPKEQGDIIFCPFYGENYNLTFNQGEDLSGPVAKLCKEKGFKKTLELFGGNGFESYILNKEIRGTQVVADIEPEYSKKCNYPELRYIVQDCIEGEPKEKYDLVFVGGSNASMCSITSIKSLNKFFVFANKCLDKDGIFCASFFQLDGENEVGQINRTYEVSKINYHPHYKGMWAHWFLVTAYDVHTDAHNYFSIVGVSDKEVIENSKDFHVLYCNESTTPMRSWPVAIIQELANKNGFVKLPQTNNVDTRCMPFVKVFDV